jgi:hypothetical protein
MKIEDSAKLSHPAPLVFATLRDKTPELAAIMPNVASVQELERREEPGRIHLYNRWQGSNSDVPKILRPFVKKDLLAWLDRATWEQASLSCSWQIDATMEGLYTCAGTTTLHAEGDGACEFRISGELRVNPDRVPGVPGFLARKLQEPLERFVGNAIRPNLTKIASAVQRYLDEHPAG